MFLFYSLSVKNIAWIGLRDVDRGERYVYIRGVWMGGGVLVFTIH